MNYEEFENMKKTTKKARFDLFILNTRVEFIKDIEGTKKIYTRDKELHPFKVCSLKGGGYALVKHNTEIIYKNKDVHLCKVEFIMNTLDLSLFGNAL